MQICTSKEKSRPVINKITWYLLLLHSYMEPKKRDENEHKIKETRYLEYIYVLHRIQKYITCSRICLINYSTYYLLTIYIYIGYAMQFALYKKRMYVQLRIFVIMPFCFYDMHFYIFLRILLKRQKLI